jgi:uncharacterized protein YprB with RNaseH-like and TPR domain
MLKNTFLHVPRIGRRTENKLWRNGYLSWEDYIQRCDSCPLATLNPDSVVGYLLESSQALEHEDARYFSEAMSSGDGWRLYADFRDKTAFVDIETTGFYSGSDAITVIGLFDGKSTKAFIQGINLEDFADEVHKYSLLVTFNGKRFDLPFICSVFGEMPAFQGHLDLLYPLKKLGYHGGLKSIEVQVGLEREGALKQMDGYLAVLLWKEYRRGNKTALDTLVRYNLEDVVNLQYLADKVYNEASAELPIAVEPLPQPEKYLLDIPYDTELVEYLADQVREQRTNRW